MKRALRIARPSKIDDYSGTSSTIFGKQEGRQLSNEMSDRCAVRECYTSLYGNPSREAEFVAPSGKVVEVLKWDAQATGEDVCIYATIGACDQSLGLLNEYFIGLSPEEDSIVYALAEIALYGNGTMKTPKTGDSVTLSSDVWQNTGMTSFLFTDGSGIIAPFAHGGVQISFVQVVPIYAEELEFKKKNGEKALWDLFEMQAVEYWNPCREQAIRLD